MTPRQSLTDWSGFAVWVWRHERLRAVGLTAYYLGILLGLLALYGRGNFTAPSYIYQAF